MPVVTKAINSGTAEQEQKGVTMPISAANTFPTDSRLPASIARVRSGVMNDRTIPIPNTATVISISTFGASKTKNSTAEPRCSPRLSCSNEYVIQAATGSRYE